MKRVSRETRQYMDMVWKLNNSNQLDELTMLWESNSPELVCKRLVDQKIVKPNSDAAREMIEVAQSITKEEEAQLINKIDRKYNVIECRNCNELFYLSQQHDIRSWITGSCSKCGSDQCLVKVKARK